MSSKTHKRQTGVTLVELMIGLLIGLIVVAGGLSVFITALKGQADNIKLTRLNQDLRAMMDIMVRDIRRAGFVTSHPDTYIASLQDNPFFDETTDIAVLDYDGGSQNCILYAYNLDDDPVRVPIDPKERLGFRLNSSGELAMRVSDKLDNTTCNTEPNDRVWERITEPEVEITSLMFTLKSAKLDVSSMSTDSDNDGCYDGDDGDDGDDQDPITVGLSCKTGTYGNNLCDDLCDDNLCDDKGESCNIRIGDGRPDHARLYVRKVAISLTGRLRDDNAVTQTIAEQVRVRNDKYLAPR